jgi:hypothetical protein
MEFLDGCSLLSAFLVAGIEHAIGIIAFTVGCVLASGCAPVLAEVDQTAAAAV